MEQLISIIGFRRTGAYRAHLSFSDGMAGEWDFSPLSSPTTEMLRPFRKPEYFDRVMFSPRFLAWPNGYDWCADALYADMHRAGVLARSEGTAASDIVGRLVPLPREVEAIYQAVATLERNYPGRKFTPDGHLVGSIGEVIAREALGLTLYPASHPGHDAHDAEGRQVQVKLTGGSSVALRATCEQLLVMRVFDLSYAEIVYYGDGEAVWQACGKPQASNGQRTISLSKLRAIAKSAAA
ncbi:hypothetical protein ACETK8_17565 [Brevundimonas staleyi]|uniref:DUF6998 domain-containing protein n=1 Tax=Brevundimonas staleyi TaxID=74326 RepID=A0ABW0FUG9_9CAUL